MKTRKERKVIITETPYWIKGQNKPFGRNVALHQMAKNAASSNSSNKEGKINSKKVRKSAKSTTKEAILMKPKIITLESKLPEWIDSGYSEVGEANMNDILGSLHRSPVYFRLVEMNAVTPEMNVWQTSLCHLQGKPLKTFSDLMDVLFVRPDADPLIPEVLEELALIFEDRKKRSSDMRALFLFADRCGLENRTLDAITEDLEDKYPELCCEFHQSSDESEEY